MRGAGNVDRDQIDQTTAIPATARADTASADSVPADFAHCVGWWARKTPEAAALILENGTVSYADLDRRIVSTMQMLTGRGIVEGDRVAICAANRIEIIELLFACARLGAILVLVNNRLTGAEIRFQLEDCQPSLVITQDLFADAMAATGWDFEALDVVSTAYTDAPDADTDVAAAGRAGLDQDVLLVYTSGTTGKPKGAVLTQRSLYYTILNGVEHEGFDGNSVTISVLPMFHVGGLNIQLLPCLFVGGHVVIEERFDPARLVNLLQQHRPTHLILVPAIMQALLVESDDIGADMASLGALNCGSSVVSVELIERYVAASVRVVQVYGATETGPTSIVLDYADADRYGSCGKAAEHTEVRIQTPDGEIAAPGVVGELVLRGPNLFDRYWQNPEATDASIRDGWYFTGDLGFIDEEGFTYVTGRSKEMIISGGENIYPAELEQLIEQHQAVTEVAVVGQPDTKWGEVPVAFVVCTTPAPTADELSSWTRDQIAGYKQPRSWILLDELPRTSLGKVQKHRLLEERMD